MSSNRTGEDDVRAEPDSTAIDFTAVYDRWFAEVVRWVPAMGGPPADVEDLAQEVFLTVHRRLTDFDGQNLGGWLYAIAVRTVANHRRRAWFRHLIFKPTSDAVFQLSAPAANQPAALLEQKQLLDLTERALAKMKPIHRRVLVLFDVEGYSGDEIAALEGIPVATVWTRLHHARKVFVEATKKLRKEWER